MIGDLKVPASLQGFRVTAYLKQAQKIDVSANNAVFHFCPGPTHSELSEVFDNLISPPRKYYFAYFSDDSCLSIRTTSGEIVRYNVDISSCDASHTPALFEAYQKLPSYEAADDLSMLVDQLRKPIRVYDLADRRRYVELRNERGDPTLYSGSTITTSVNNFASLLIGQSIATSGAETEREIIAAARDVGYLITLEKCDLIEDIQFLKHSPVLDTKGAWQPLLNIGVLLRLSGTCTGDLPGTTHESLEDRAAVFQKALLQGAYPRSNFALVDNMKSVVVGATGRGSELAERRVATALAYKVRETVHAIFDSEDVYRRYRLTPHQMRMVDDDFGRAAIGTFHHNPALSCIMERDYGLHAY
jgi:hypothetical protein